MADDLRQQVADLQAELKQARDGAQGWFRSNWQGMLVGAIIAWALAITGLIIGG